VLMLAKSLSTRDPPTTLSFRLFFFFVFPTSSRGFFGLPFLVTAFFLSLSTFELIFLVVLVFFLKGGGEGDLAFRRLFEAADTGYRETDRLMVLKIFQIFVHAGIQR